MLNSIDAYRREIQMQPQYLKNLNFTHAILPTSVQKDTIFAGSGDSLAAAMLGEYFSSGRARAMDPLDVISCLPPTLASFSPSPSDFFNLDRMSAIRDKNMYLVSVSGKTRANITVAKRMANSVAITSDPKSVLARSTDNHVIPLQFPSTNKHTAGSISFLASALTCMSLVCDFSTRNIFPEKILYAARRDASNIDVSGSLYILGNSLTYPLAMYGAAKFYEVLGYDARYARLEQFFHMDLFSANSGDTVLLLSPPSFDGSVDLSGLVGDALEQAGVRLVVPSSFDRYLGPDNDMLALGPLSLNWSMNDYLKCVLYCIFLLQTLVLNMADTQHLSECHYITSENLRHASNVVIYNDS